MLDLSTLEIAEPIDPLIPLEITVHCNTDGTITKENVLSAAKRDLRVIAPLPANDRIAVLVGGGPSLQSSVPEISNWYAMGADIFALNGAAKFLNGLGILPTFQVMIDPRPENKILFAEAKEYLIASQCAPEVFDSVPAHKTALFHLVGSAMGLVNGTLVGGNVTVGLTAMCLAHTLGFRALHLYGYDSSYADETHHAYPQEQNDEEKKLLDVQIYDKDGKLKKFVTNYAMAKQAQLFPETCKLLTDDDSVIYVHGTGLIPTMAHSFHKI